MEKKEVEHDTENSAPAGTMTAEPRKKAEPVPASSRAMTPGSTQASPIALLYKGSRVSGQLTFKGPVLIDGNVEGEIQCHGTLTIGEGADVRAQIASQVVVIRGKVEGNVTAKEKVELLSPARVVGNISTPRLSITEGAAFDGDCSMGVAKQKRGVASPQPKGSDKAGTARAPSPQADSSK